MRHGRTVDRRKAQSSVVRRCTKIRAVCCPRGPRTGGRKGGIIKASLARRAGKETRRKAKKKKKRRKKGTGLTSASFPPSAAREGKERR
jgi:hypothetical protein